MSYRDSDLDYKERMYGPDESVLAERQAEEAREQRWAEFVAYLRTINVQTSLITTARLYNTNRDDFSLHDDHDIRFLAFSESEGWDGVLNALARAMREDEQYRKELVDRR